MSAISNMMGFYASGDARKDVDYPSVVGWPGSFVPVPIHAVPNQLDPMVWGLVSFVL